ncbi:MAG: hypothetical protein HUK26_07860 [Duodenibacillus sp.]|nr:hypothetical protein [Duodenibacillus sp.]
MPDIINTAAELAAHLAAGHHFIVENDTLKTESGFVKFFKNILRSSEQKARINEGLREKMGCILRDSRMPDLRRSVVESGNAHVSLLRPGARKALAEQINARIAAKIVSAKCEDVPAASRKAVDALVWRLVTARGAASQPARAREIADQALAELTANPARMRALDFESFPAGERLQEAVDGTKDALIADFEKCLAASGRADGVPATFLADCKRGCLRSVNREPVGAAETKEELAARTEKIISDIKDALFGPGKEELSEAEKRQLSFITYALSQGGLGASIIPAVMLCENLAHGIDGQGGRLMPSQRGHSADILILKDEGGAPAEARLRFTYDADFIATHFMGVSLTPGDGDGYSAGAGHFELEMTLDLRQPWTADARPAFTLSCTAGPLAAAGTDSSGKALLPSAMRHHAAASSVNARLRNVQDGTAFDSLMAAAIRAGQGRPAELDIAMQAPADLARAADELYAMSLDVKEAVDGLGLDEPSRVDAMRVAFEAMLRSVPGLEARLGADPAARGELARMLGVMLDQDAKAPAALAYAVRALAPRQA